MVSENVKQELEELRKKYLSLSKKYSILRIAVPGLACFSIVFFIFLFINPVVCVIGTGSVFLLALIMEIAKIILKMSASAALRRFKELYKAEFVKGVLEESLDSVEEYKGAEGLAVEELRSYRLISMLGMPYTEDYLKARYKGITFEQSNVKLVKYRNKREITCFSGYVLKLPSPRQVSSVRIFSKDFTIGDSGKGFQVYFGGGNAAPIGSYSPDRIETQDSEFNEKFCVWAEQKQDMYYLLEPRFIQLLKSLLCRYPSIGFHFRDNEVYVAIETPRDTFDCDMNEPVDYIMEKEMIKGDINQIKGIIETLQLQKN